MRSFSAMLGGGDRRSIGRSDAVVAAVRRTPGRFEELWRLLKNDDPIVRMRAADAAEKLSRDDPSSLAPHKKLLLSGAFDDGTAEMRWHLIALTARLPLSGPEAEELMGYFAGRLREDASRIVRVAALQAAFELCTRHPKLKDEFDQVLKVARDAPMPSLRARAKKLSADRGLLPKASS